MEHERFHYKDLDTLRDTLGTLHAELPLSEDLAVLNTPVSFAGLTAVNRIAIQPMEGCDGTADGAPDEQTIARYDRFARSGAALIWEEATAVVPEGRANPRQLWIHDGNLDDYKRFVERIKSACMRENGFEPVVIMQATHSGRYAKPTGVPAPMIAYNSPVFEAKNPIDPSRIVSDEYLDTLAPAFAKAAALAEKAGFDGVDVKCCHRYLISELMSAYTRPGKYGGCFENRSRLYMDCIDAAKAAVSSGYVVTSRFNAYDGFDYPWGFGTAEGQGITPVLDEAVRTVKMLRDKGLSLLDVTIGNPYFNPHVNRPYDNGGYVPPEHPLEGLARMMHCVGTVKAACPEMTVISSAHSYLRELAPYMAAGAVSQGICDMTGFGRMAFAYPSFPKDILEKGKLDGKQVCLACGKCTELMRAGTIAGCVMRNPYYTALYREKVVAAGKVGMF